MTLSQGHISKVKVTVHTYSKLFRPSLLTAMFNLDNSSHNRIMTLTRDEIANVKVTVYTRQKFVSGPLPSTGNLHQGDTSHNDPGVVAAGTIYPVRTSLVLIRLKSSLCFVSLL